MPKNCQCPGCTYPVFAKGYCRSHQYMREAKPVREPVDRGLFKSDPTQKKEPVERNLFKREVEIIKPKPVRIYTTDEDQDAWFLARREEMTGICAHCGGPTTKLSDKYWKYSIAHIFGKKDNIGGFPSVKTHTDNWIELCFWSPACHGNFDTGKLSLLDLNCLDLVIQKAVRIYPFIAPQERKYISPILMEYIKTEL